jgi:chromosome segregation ATPase
MKKDGTVARGVARVLRPRAENLSAGFFPDARPPSAISNGPFLTEIRGRSYGPLIPLSETSRRPKTTMRNSAEADRRAIREWLDIQRPHFTLVLRRLTESPSQYSKLIGMACDEFEHQSSHFDSDAVDKLEKDAEIRSALIEAEILSAQRNIERLKQENIQLRKDVKDNEALLKNLNMEVGQLFRLLDKYGVDLNSAPVIRKHRQNESLEIVPEQVQLNENCYRDLWAEQQHLLEKIEVLREGLEERRQKQFVEIRNCVKRRWPYLFVLNC